MGKRAVWISGVVAAGVLALGALSSRELAVRYHAARMERDRAWFMEGVVRPRGTVVADAARRLITGERFGGKVLLETYLGEIARLDTNFQNILQQHSGVYEETRISIGSTGVLGVHSGWKDPGFSGKRVDRVTKLNAPETVLARLRAIQDLLAEADFTCAEVPNYPGAEFSFHLVPEPLPEPGLVSPYRAPAPYCFVRWPERSRKN